MNIMIINCHTANRGDEAAVKALVDKINEKIICVNIVLALFTDTVYPGLPQNVKVVRQLKTNGKRGLINYLLALLIKGSIMPNLLEKEYIDALKNSDIVLHAPGGPSIGDIYYNDEISYLRNYNIVRRFKKRYMFFAPSMGPFKTKKRNAWRKKVLLGAEKIVVRDPISQKYVEELIPNANIELALDSALQYDFNAQINYTKLSNYTELDRFLSKYKKCIGITITDLKWHPVLGKDKTVSENIASSFIKFIDYLTQNGYGIVFIPQLYGCSNDYNFMSLFAINSDSCFTVYADHDEYESYFQQYLISRMYAVVGMRYHSNIFSAKAGTPFISVSYEQKMQGFMDKLGIQNFCIPIDELNAEQLENKFNYLVKKYEEYKNKLESSHNWMKAESAKTIDILIKLLGN